MLVPTCPSHVVGERDLAGHEDDDMVDVISLQDIKQELSLSDLLHVSLHLKYHNDMVQP